MYLLIETLLRILWIRTFIFIEKHIRVLPDIFSDPLYQVTLGIGFPPPDSQSNLNSCPSLYGPIRESEISLLSIEIFTYFGSAAKIETKKKLKLDT